MADTVSLVAATLQIAELLAKIVLRTRRLANQLKDAPEEIRRKAQSLDDFQSLCTSCQHVLTQNSAQIADYIRREDVDCIRNLLGRAEVRVDSLETIISILQPLSTDGRFESWLKAAKTVHKGKDITAHVGELCELRAQIDSFFVRRSWSLLAAQSTKTEKSFAVLQASQSRTDASISDVRRHQNNDRKEIDVVKMTISEINASQQAGFQVVEEVKTNSETGFASLYESTQVLKSVVRATGMDIEAQINRGFEGVQSSLAAISLSDESIRRLALQVAEQGLVQPPSNTVSYTPGPLSMCPCQRVGRAARLITIGPITIVSGQFGAHQPGCQYHGQSNTIVTERRLSVQLRGRYGQCATTSLTRFAVTASSFLSGSLWFANIVDDHDYKAPGFIHMGKAKFDILDALKYHSPSGINYPQIPWISYPQSSTVSPEALHRCQRALKQLHSCLLEDFNMSRNWARVQTNSGRTLLHELTEILMQLWTVQDEVSDIVTKIIRLLIDGGISVTGTIPRSWPLSDNYTDGHDYQTALSYCTSRLSESNVTSRNRTLFLQIFSEHGIPAFSSSSQEIDPWLAVRLFVAIPDLAIEYGCSRLCLAVINRDGSQVEHLLRSGAKVNDTSQNFSALAFAIEWPAGVRILLAGGADASQAIQYAARYQNIESLKLLLEADTLFFEPEKTSGARADRDGIWEPPNLVSLIDLALWNSRIPSKFDKMVFAEIVRAFALARNELMTVAKKNLSISQLKDLGWANAHHPRHLLDSAAGKIFAKLQEMGMELRKNLWPGRGKTIYLTPWMSADFAEMLFEAGFTEIDEFDQDGITPLLINTRFPAARRDRLVLLWFLRRGAKKMVFPMLKNTTFIHKLAVELGKVWSIRSSINTSISEEVTQWLTKILNKCAKLLPAQPIDFCQCFCSREGCSPIQSLIKHMKHYSRANNPGNYSCWATKLDLFELWNNSCPEALAGSPNFTAFCRIELFERLGMRHTCCEFRELYQGGLCYPRPLLHFLEPSEVSEFRAEDAHSNLKLEGLMSLYDELASMTNSLQSTLVTLKSFGAPGGLFLKVLPRQRSTRG